MTSKILQKTINAKSNTFDVIQLQDRLNATRKKDWRDSGIRKKNSFSPSQVGNFGGACPRYWYYAFHGAFFEEKFRPQSVAAMNNGTDSHQRIQKTYEHAGLDAEIELEVLNDDPPIRGFADVVVTVDGCRAVGDIKTINSTGYTYIENSMKPKPAHLTQILIYMRVLGLTHGFMHYENKDNHDELFIPIVMTPRYEKYLDKLWEWMREIVQLDDLPTRSFTKNSPNCKYCPLSKTCWSDSDGSGSISKLSAVTA